MDYPPARPPLPADYYRRQATRVRQLADDATTPAIKEHLEGVARDYEWLAEQVEAAAPHSPELDAFHNGFSRR